MTETYDEASAHWPRIPEFFAGRSIFVTGGTGFIGKVLIEKLLWSCPDIREIFMLMRPKRGVPIDDRLRQMLKLPLFDRIRETNPALFDKLIPVSGDTTEDGLGLGPVERQVLIDRVSVVFHTAANVKFDDTLKQAVFVNTRSTRDVCILGASMKNLVALMHVSSTYTQTDKPVVEEAYYDPKIDWRKLIRQVETVDESILNAITPKYIHPMPNTYTFSKRVAEKVVHDFSKDIPCVVFRPSIVISAVDEPFRGWVDNMNGPVGLLIGGGKGIVRAVYGNWDQSPDYIPVDFVVKMLVIATWKRGVVTITQDPSMHVYNSAAASIRKITTEDMIKIGFEQHSIVPMDDIFWYPGVTITTCFYYYYIVFMIFQLLPSLLIDQILKFNGYPQILYKLQQKIYVSNMTLSYFLTNTWVFKNEKCAGLLSLIHPVDVDHFGIKYMRVDIKEYYKESILGVKKYILHEDLNKMEANKTRLTRLYWIKVARDIWLVSMFVWFLMQYETFPYDIALVGGLFLSLFI